MIFISYQRNDDSVTPKLVRNALTRGIRSDAAAFLDIDSIPPGVRFADVILAALDQCTTVLAMIGPHWNPSRLADPDDYVRLELLTAQRLGKRIVPVPHGGRSLPRAIELPVELRFLLDTSAFFLGGASTLEDDIERLVVAARNWVPKRSLARLAQGDFVRAAALDFKEPWKIKWLFTDEPIQATH